MVKCLQSKSEDLNTDSRNHVNPAGHCGPPVIPGSEGKDLESPQ